MHSIEPLSASRIVLVTLGILVAPGGAVAQQSRIIDLTAEQFDIPSFEGYEVEYTSAFGRFFNQVRPFELDGVPKISVLNIIDMPGAVIVDSKVIDRATLRLEHMASPFFAWGQEYAVSRADAEGFEWVRIPLRGGEPTRITGSAQHGGFIDDLGFSPTFAALIPQPIGTRMRLPSLQPRSDGTMGTVTLEYEVIGRESLELKSGVTCDCWIIEQTDSAGGVHRFWVSREAPFVFKRRRDVGGARDFVSEVLSFRRY